MLLGKRQVRRAADGGGGVSGGRTTRISQAGRRIETAGVDSLREVTWRVLL